MAPSPSPAEEAKPARPKKARPTVPAWEDVLLGVRSGGGQRYTPTVLSLNRTAFARDDALRAAGRLPLAGVLHKPVTTGPSSGKRLLPGQ